MSAHTEGPWEFTHKWVQTVDNKKTPIANFNFYAGKEENARRIILCCNMHDELLETLREALDDLEAASQPQTPTINKIHAVIAKATRGPE